MMEVIVEVFQAVDLTVCEKKTAPMCMPPPRTLRMMIQDGAGRQTYKQVKSFTYLGGAIIETQDISTEITRLTRACWMYIRRY